MRKEKEHAFQIPPRLADPLGHYRPAQIPFVVREFCKNNGFITKRELDDGQSLLNRLKDQEITDIDLNKPLLEGRLARVVLLERGFLLGRNRRFVQHLTQEDLDCLQDEGKGLLRRQSWHLYAVITLCCMGGALQGWDQTGSAAANLSWPSAFCLDFYIPTDKHSHANLDAWIVGVVNAMPYFVAPVGCLLSDPLNDWLGRLTTIFVAAIFCLVSVLGCALAEPPHWGQLLACRALLGIGMGLKASTVPLLASESAPRLIRGSLIMQWQVNVALGIFLGSLANLATYRMPDPWRFQLGCAFIPAVPVLLAVWFVPESPVWLLRKGDVLGAYDTLRKLRTRPVVACRDLFVMYHANRLEQEYMRRPPPHGTGIHYHWLSIQSSLCRIKELFTIPRNRRATWSSLVVMVSQQLCGINIIAFYCATLYLGNQWRNPNLGSSFGSGSGSGSSGSLRCDANVNVRSPDVHSPDVLKALYISVGFGLCNFLFSFPAVKTIDKFGRVPLLLATFPLMALSLMGLSLSFWKTPENPTASELSVNPGTIACILLFTIFYSSGEGPVPFTYSAEVFPATHREVGMALGVSANLFSAGALTVFFPALLTAVGPAPAIGLFAGLNMIAFVLIWLLVVETKQLPLEVVTERFSHPTGELVWRRLNMVLPTSWRRPKRIISDGERQEQRSTIRNSDDAHEAPGPKSE